MYGAIYGMNYVLPFLCSQSLHGHHHLFEPALIKRAFNGAHRRGPAVDKETAAATESLLTALEQDEDLGGHKARIADAPDAVQNVMVHLYFDFIYKYMAQRKSTVH